MADASRALMDLLMRGVQGGTTTTPPTAASPQSDHPFQQLLNRASPIPPPTQAPWPVEQSTPPTNAVSDTSADSPDAVLRFQDGVVRTEGKNVAVCATAPGNYSSNENSVQVHTYTMYPMDKGTYLGKLVAANKNYLAYCVKVKLGWGVRLLNPVTGTRGMIRGHTKMVSDIRFASDDLDVVASVDQGGDLLVHRLKEENDEIAAEMELFVRRSSVRQTPNHRVLWLHGAPGTSLAVATDNVVEMWDIPSVKSQISSPEVERNDITHGVVVLTGHTMAVNDLAISADGLVLATASDDGTVRFWDTQDRSGRCLRSWTPQNGAPVTSVALLHDPTAPDAKYFITMGANNTIVHLWDGRNASLLQTVSIRDDNGEMGSMRMHACIDPSGEYCVLAALEPKQAVYMLSLADTASPQSEQRLRITKVREFQVTDSVLSFVAANCEMVHEEKGAGEDEEAPAKEVMELKLYAVQTKKIQRLVLKFPPPSLHEAEQEMATDADASLVSPMELLALQGASEALSEPAVQPRLSMSTPPPQLGTDLPPASPQDGSFEASPAYAPVETMTPEPQAATHAALPAVVPEVSAPPPAAADMSGLLAAMRQIMLESEDRMAARIDAVMMEKLTRIEQEQRRQEKALEERLTMLVNSTITQNVQAGMQPIPDLVKDTLAQSLLPQFDRSTRDVLNKLFANKTATDAIALSAASAIRAPLSESFSAAIQHSLVPAYDALTKNMMAQLKEAIDKSTADYLEHVQREVAIHGSPTSLQNTLREVQQNVASIKAATDTVAPAITAHTGSITTSVHSAVDSIVPRITESVRTAIKAENRDLLRQMPTPTPQQPATAPAVSSAAPQSRRTSATPTNGQEQDMWGQICKSLLSEDYEASFSKALARLDVELVVRLCRSVDMPAVLRSQPCPLSQPILMSLVQQLSAKIGDDTQFKVHIMTEALRCINIQDKLTRSYLPILMPKILDPVRNLFKERSQGPDGPALYNTLQQLEGLARAVQGPPMQ